MREERISNLVELVEKIGRTLKLTEGVEDDLYTLPVWVDWVLNDLKETHKLLQEIVAKEVENV